MFENQPCAVCGSLLCRFCGECPPDGHRSDCTRPRPVEDLKKAILSFLDHDHPGHFFTGLVRTLRPNGFCDPGEYEFLSEREIEETVDQFVSWYLDSKRG